VIGGIIGKVFMVDLLRELLLFEMQRWLKGGKFGRVE
jgi:hypothetical protein